MPYGIHHAGCLSWQAKRVYQRIPESNSGGQNRIKSLTDAIICRDIVDTEQCSGVIVTLVFMHQLLMRQERRALQKNTENACNTAPPCPWNKSSNPWKASILDI